MEEFISQAADSLKKFLADTETKRKEINSGNVLVSFGLPLVDFLPDAFIKSLARHYERSFYFEKPGENFLIIGLDEALTIAENGEGRFAVTDKKVKEIRNSFVSNWGSLSQKNVPLFLGGMKFTSEHNEEDWQDFNDSTWFVPEILILIKNESKFIFFNFQNQNSSKDQAVKKFTAKLEKLFSLNVKSDNLAPAKILRSSGDTPKDKKKWKQLVVEGLNKISENAVEKVVFSRKVEMVLSNEPGLTEIVKKLRADYPGCYIFLYHHGKSTFFGASPEKLAKFSDGSIEIDALAGSAPRGKTEEEDLQIEKNLLNDSKNLNEHNYVVDHIKNSLSNLTEDFKLESHCTIKKLANIQHIWSRATAKISSKSSMLYLLKELYPTPAICGFPKDAALQLIKKLEGYKRGLYSGIIGWFNLDDEGEFAVALRSGLLTNNKLIAFAGGGIVQNSDPEAEYKETELKLKTILSLFNNENKN